MDSLALPMIDEPKTFVHSANKLYNPADVSKNFDTDGALDLIFPSTSFRRTSGGLRAESKLYRVMLFLLFLTAGFLPGLISN